MVFRYNSPQSLIFTRITYNNNILYAKGSINGRDISFQVQSDLDYTRTDL